MSDPQLLRAGLNKMKTAVYWASQGKINKGYGVVNQGEADRIDAYVSAIAAGQNPTKPILVTPFGQGLVDIIASGQTATTPPPPPPPPPPPTGRFPYRAIYNIDADFAAVKAAMATLGLNGIEAQVFTYLPNLKVRMDQLAGSQRAWNMLGRWTPSISGGTHSISDADVATILAGIKTHPQNSHRYYLADEPYIAGYTTAQQDLCRAVVKARRDLIHREDPSPETVVQLAEFRQAQLDPVMSGRPGGMWKGIVDEVVLSSYPFPNAVATPGHIPMVASWCDAAGMRYSFALSVHNYKNTIPAYPTVAQMQFAVDQIAATKSVDLYLYIWQDAWDTSDFSSPNLHLRDDLAMQGAVGAKLATFA